MMKSDNKFTGLNVAVRDGNIDEAIAILKRKVKEENIMIDLKKRERYVKPSELRREMKNKAKLRNKYNKQKNS